MAILCGLLPPVNRFAGILRNTLSEVVGKGEVKRAPGIPGQCRLMVPDRGFFPVLLYALAVQIPIAQSVFRCGISGMGQFLQFLKWTAPEGFGPVDHMNGRPPDCRIGYRCQEANPEYWNEDHIGSCELAQRSRKHELMGLVC